MDKNSERVYTKESAPIIGHMICEIVEKTRQYGASLAQHDFLHKGLKHFGNKGTKAISDEMNQLHQRNCFAPIIVSSLMTNEKKGQWRHLCLLPKKELAGLRHVRYTLENQLEHGWINRRHQAQQPHLRV